MTATTTIIPGQRIGHFEILSVDPTGKRVCVGCPCGNAHIFGVETLLNGAASCAAMPLTVEQEKARRVNRRFRWRVRALKDWRPGARS
jgi:hypothetical protein